MGCPLEDLCNRGSGAGMMDRTNKMGEIIRGMYYTLNIPYTVKMRIGVKDGKPLAGKVVNRVKHWGAQLATIHGRTKEQRYTKLADWDFINSIAEQNPEIPVFGNGDVLSFEEYYQRLESTAVKGAMIGRGALIKPWLFTEIKERRYWDISANERLELYRDFAKFGLEHWGSDTQGINVTRRFLLEWMSFTCRYTPVGLLEVLPPGINNRPPMFCGRNELETLLSSSNVEDWIKVTERIPELAKAPADFVFTPKHKANSYATPRS